MTSDPGTNNYFTQETGEPVEYRIMLITRPQPLNQFKTQRWYSLVEPFCTLSVPSDIVSNC
jgi:hypothetical protein